MLCIFVMLLMLIPPVRLKKFNLHKSCQLYGDYFAVKELRLINQGEEEIIHLEQEIAFLSEFEHENIVQYHGTYKEMTRKKLESLSFSSTLNDDDSSSTTTDPMSSISPNGKFRRDIKEWQKGHELGCGSFGTVYEGYTEGFFFAAKQVSLLDHGDEGIIQLGQEIALLSEFEHENIVQYYGINKDERHLYIFLELVTKGSLLSLYQDIKCGNILVHVNGLVKLADFGLAKAIELNNVKSSKGIARWTAPEMAALHRIGNGERPPIPDSLSSDARDFVLQCLQV